MAKLLTNASVRALPELPADAVFTTNWESVTWLTDSGSQLQIWGDQIWEHNGTIYYSYISSQYTYNKITKRWTRISWTVGSTANAQIKGANIFEISGTKYLLFNSSLYYLPSDDTTNTWMAVTTNFVPDSASYFCVYKSVITSVDVFCYIDIDTDNSKNNSYTVAKGSSDAELVFTSKTFKLNNTKVFTGVLRGDRIWCNTNGTVWYTYNGTNYYMASDSRWNTYTLTDPSGIIAGNYVWTDGTNIYATADKGLTTKSYKLNSTTWEEMTFGGYNTIYTPHLWTDGSNIYISSGGSQYKLEKQTSDINPCYVLENGEWIKKDVFQLNNGVWEQISFK